MGINATLRPARAADRPFAQAVYFETQRWLIEKLFGWRGDEVELGKFDEFYRQDEVSVISCDGSDVGWMAIARIGGAIELDGIYIATAYQRRGLGTALVRGVMLQARLEARPLRLSTAKINPARELYRRLGFAEVEEDRYKVYMEYRAG
jgi:ribosomal protein S18 acetylase RimI-like enzyme